MQRFSLVVVVVAAAVGRIAPSLAAAPFDAQSLVAGPPFLELSSEKAAPGQQVTIGARLHAGAALIGAVQADLTFDSSNTPIAGMIGGVPDCTIAVGLDKQFLAEFRPMGCTDADCNVVRAFVYPNNFPITAIADGSALFTCKVTVQPAAPFGVYPITISNLVLADLNGNPLSSGISIDGSIDVPQPADVGTACTVDFECQSGFCTDFACCPVRACSADESCSVPGLSGGCAPKQANDAPCDGNEDCQSGLCVVGGTPLCEPQPTATPTATATATATASPSSTPSATGTATASPTPVPCVGDCNRDGEVTIDELVLEISIALGTADLNACLSADVNHDGQLTIDEILTAVNRALNGC